ncbi:hypothetical protein V8E36_008452 [Tilletia maclaganii]
MAASTSTISSPDAAAAAGVKHGYFSQPSNTHASRLLSNPNWRESNTATSESFLSGYFAKSRLHHLSTWKSQMQDIVGQALREEGSGRERGSPDLPHGTQRIIMHIDFDSYFVTVGLRTRPELRGKPVVVCHSISNTVDQHQSSTSEIASCSYEARAFGVRNGMSLGQARKYCPQIQAIPYAFQEYHDTSIQLYSLLLAHADAIEAVSVDEALIDVSLLLQALLRRDTAEIEASALAARFHSHNEAANPPMPSPATALAQALREEISERTGCSASIGIGSNVLLARLATRKAKPGGVWHLQPSAILDFTAGLDVDELHGIGWHTREDLRTRYGTINVGKLRAKLSESKLVAILGPKQGSKVYKKLTGLDRDRLEPQKLRQSVGANVNYAIRFQCQDEARAFVHKLCIEVVRRLRAAKLRGKQISVSVMIRAPDAPAEAPKFMGHGVCDVHHRSVGCSAPGGGGVDSLEAIEPKAWSLIAALNADPRELRGIGVSLHKLELVPGAMGAGGEGGGAEGGGPALTKPERGQQLLNFGVSNKAAAAVSPVKDAAGLEKDGSPAPPAGQTAKSTEPHDSAVHKIDNPAPPPEGNSKDKDKDKDKDKTPTKDKGKAPIRGGYTPIAAPIITPKRTPAASIHLGSTSATRSSGGGGSGSTPQQQQSVLPFKVDPEKMTDSQIRALSIDPEFLRALPLSIQQELIMEHSPRLKGGRMTNVLGIGSPAAQHQQHNPAGGGGGGGALGFGIGGGALFKAGQVHKYGTAGGRFWDVEAAWTALRWWSEMLDRAWPEGEEEGGEVARAWWGKWSEVREEVRRRVSARVGREVSI